MDFEEARLMLLYVLTHELLLEELSQAKDQKRDPVYSNYDEAAYEVLIGNRDRNIVVHILNYSEGEMVEACQNHWSAFVT